MPQIGINDPIEIIVSDNFSTDDTLNIISEYTAHPRFILIKQSKNEGPIKNGIDIIKKYANGKFCWYVGDDDYIIIGKPAAVQFAIDDKLAPFKIFISEATKSRLRVLLYHSAFSTLKLMPIY